MDRILIFAIAGWSGFFLMGIELLCGRILAPYFGSSIHVWGAVIATFLLALSIGYLMGGRLSIREPSITKLSFILLTAAVLTMPVVLMGDQVLDRISTLVQDPRYGSLLSVMVLFFIPTIFAGMVLPYAVRLLVSECRLSGHYTGLLYFTSTFGSAAGTLLTSFYLVLYLEINQILWILIGTSAALSLLTLAFGLFRNQIEDN